MNRLLIAALIAAAPTTSAFAAAIIHDATPSRLISQLMPAVGDDHGARSPAVVSPGAIYSNLTTGTASGWTFAGATASNLATIALADDLHTTLSKPALLTQFALRRDRSPANARC